MSNPDAPLPPLLFEIENLARKLERQRCIEIVRTALDIGKRERRLASAIVNLIRTEDKWIA